MTERRTYNRANAGKAKKFAIVEAINQTQSTATAIKTMNQLQCGRVALLGYRSVGQKLEIVPEEAALVRKIFGATI